MAVCEKFYLPILFYNPFLFFSNALIFRKKNLSQIRESSSIYFSSEGGNSEAGRMPSPRRPHGRRPDSYQPEKGRDRGGRTSDDRSRTYPNENECPRAKDCPGETDFNEQKSHRKKGNSDFAPGENKRPPRCPGRKNEIPQDGNGQNTRPTER